MSQERKHNKFNKLARDMRQSVLLPLLNMEELLNLYNVDKEHRVLVADYIKTRCKKDHAELLLLLKAACKLRHKYWIKYVIENTNIPQLDAFLISKDPDERIGLINAEFKIEGDDPDQRLLLVDAAFQTQHEELARIAMTSHNISGEFVEKLVKFFVSICCDDEWQTHPLVNIDFLFNQWNKYHNDKLSYWYKFLEEPRFELRTDPYEEDDKGNVKLWGNYLQFTCQYSRLDIIKHLIEDCKIQFTQPANKVAVYNTRTKDRGYTYVTTPAGQKTPRILITDRVKAWANPLWIAAFFSDVSVINYLMQRGASLYLPNAPQKINQKAHQALIFYMKYFLEKIIQFLDDPELHPPGRNWFKFKKAMHKDQKDQFREKVLNHIKNLDLLKQNRTDQTLLLKPFIKIMEDFRDDLTSYAVYLFEKKSKRYWQNLLKLLHLRPECNWMGKPIIVNVLIENFLGLFGDPQDTPMYVDDSTLESKAEHKVDDSTSESKTERKHNSESNKMVEPLHNITLEITNLYAYIDIHLKSIPKSGSTPVMFSSKEKVTVELERLKEEITILSRQIPPNGIPNTETFNAWNKLKESARKATNKQLTPKEFHDLFMRTLSYQPRA